MSATSILFPLYGPRLTTILAIALFFTLAITQHDRLPVYSCLAWLFGWEAVFEATTWALGRPELGVPHVALYLVVCVVALPWLTRKGARPDWRFLVPAVAFYIVWVATGFHINEHSGKSFDAAAEVWNEAAKILWAAAYLAPLLACSRSGWGKGASRQTASSVLAGRDR